MQIGAITGYIDLAQIILYLFWIFFAGIIFYLILENHREGYPMESEEPGSPVIAGWPIPAPKIFRLANGKNVTVPDLARGEPPQNIRRDGTSYGNPYDPIGDPMTAGVGPGSYVLRSDVPDMDLHGHPVIRPLRVLNGFGISQKDTEPRGLPVFGADGKLAGKVIDVWIDTCEMMLRYLEIDATSAGVAHRILLPVPFARIKREGVFVKSIYAAQFASVPGIRNADQVTLLEEDKISAYYGGGTLYADPARSEPIL